MDASLPGPSEHGIPRQAYWSRLAFPSPEDLSHLGTEPGSAALEVDFLLVSYLGSPIFNMYILFYLFYWNTYGEGNGTPLQYSCLENPMDGGAWTAAVHGSLRVRYGWATSLLLFTFMYWRRQWQPTPVFLPGESQGQGSLMGCRLRGCTESDTTKVT